MFSEWLVEHGGAPSLIGVVAMAMSKAFTSGCTQYLPNAHIVYDKFHVVQEANKRLDEVRKAEAKGKKLLKGHWLYASLAGDELYSFLTLNLRPQEIVGDERTQSENV